jgi:hypothetical protein
VGFLEKHVNNKFGRAILAELVAEQRAEDAAGSVDANPDGSQSDAPQLAQSA